MQGLCVLVDALEDINTPEQEMKVLPSAVSWIVNAGPYIHALELDYGSSRPQQDRTRDRDPYIAGELYKGRLGFSKQHWDFWKQRFAQLEQDKNLSEAGQTLAAIGLRSVDAIELGYRPDAPFGTRVTPSIYERREKCVHSLRTPPRALCESEGDEKKSVQSKL